MRWASALLLFLGLAALLVAAAAAPPAERPLRVNASAPSATLAVVSDRAVAGRGDNLNLTVWLNGTGNGQFQRTWVNLTLNNVGFYAQPLAPSGQNATFLIGTPPNQGTYHLLWINRAHNGLVSVGDVFWVTGDGVGLPGLSYVKVSLIWDGGVWHADEYFVTSETIV